MSIIELPRQRLSRQWISDMVEAIWQIRLEPFQLDDLEKLVGGGIYTLMYPTDHGKSMLLEMAAVLRLAVNPNRRILVVKINDGAAKETVREICRRLLIASWLVDDEGFLVVAGVFDGGVFRPTAGAHKRRLYPGLEPLGVRWLSGGDPYGIADGFDVAGIERTYRNSNRSVRCYGLGARDLQGKRGDTLIDDIEREEEARSDAYRI